MELLPNLLGRSRSEHHKEQTVVGSVSPLSFPFRDEEFIIPASGRATDCKFSASKALLGSLHLQRTSSFIGIPPWDGLLIMTDNNGLKAQSSYPNSGKL